MFCLGKDIGAKRRRSETSAASSLLFDSDVMRPKGSYHATERELPWHKVVMGMMREDLLIEH